MTSAPVNVVVGGGEGKRVWEPSPSTGQLGRQKPIDGDACLGHSACCGQCRGARVMASQFWSQKFPSASPLCLFIGQILCDFFFCLHHKAYRIWIPRPRLNSCPLQWKCIVQTTGPPGNPFVWLFLSRTRGSGWKQVRGLLWWYRG